MPGHEWRHAHMIQQSKGVDGQSLRQAFHPRWTSCISRKLFKVGAQGSEAVGSNIVRSGPAAIERQHIEVHQIMGVNELDPISATADEIAVPDLKSVVRGKSGSVSVDLGGGCLN